ncbi:MAG TPA: hypothetical protein VK892_10400 [Pyrinomonadaceae bacterium]|nr:hypothetical protein [Pyrinomonadaceae bacterium]
MKTALIIIAALLFLLFVSAFLVYFTICACAPVEENQNGVIHNARLIVK